MVREKQIEEMAEAIFQNCNCGLFYSEAEKIARFVIEEQGYSKQSEPISCSHEKGGEWISIDERSPKKRQRCLCYYPEKDYGSKIVVDYAETDDGGFAEQFQFGKPSHWMPLPKAPKMKGGAKE